MSSEPVTVTSPSVSAPASAQDPRMDRSFVGHARLIGGWTLISRLLGLAREAASAHYFGAGLVSSAFTVAFTIPNLFRKLLGEGALSAAFIPLYARMVKEEEAGAADPANPPRRLHDADDFAAASISLLTVILIAITLIGEGIIAAMILLDGQMRPDRLLTLKLLAVMLPYVILICSTAFLGAILQVHRRFGAPAAAPIILNVIHIVVMVIGARLLHLRAGGMPVDSPRAIALQTTLAYWLGFFVLAAGVLQVAILLPALKRAGFRFTWVGRFWTAPVRRMLQLSVPVALGAGVLQLSVLLDKGISLLLQNGVAEGAGAAGGAAAGQFHLFGWVLAYPMEMGAPARLNWAQYLYQFPLGIFAIALATAIFPRLSAHALDPDRTEFKNILRHGIEMTLFEGLPASVGLILVRYPAVKLLFQHGQITPHDTTLIARSVLLYAAAIWAFSLQQILNRAYYALRDTFTPLVMGIITLTVNLAVEIPLLWAPLVYNPAMHQWQPLGETAMAAGTAISFILQALVMLWMLNRRVGGLGLSASFIKIAKMILATAMMAAACLLIQKIPFYPHAETRLAWLEQLAILITTGAAVYFTACAAMGVEGIRSLLPMKHK